MRTKAALKCENLGIDNPEDVEIQIPWVRIAVIFAIAYLASLVTTHTPARQAARVCPAEALRRK